MDISTYKSTQNAPLVNIVASDAGDSGGNRRGNNRRGRGTGRGRGRGRGRGGRGRHNTGYNSNNDGDNNQFDNMFKMIKTANGVVPSKNFTMQPEVGWSKISSDEEDEKDQTKTEAKTEAKSEAKEQTKKKREKRKIYLNQEILDRIHGKYCIMETTESIIVDSLPTMPKAEKPKLTWLTFDPVWCKNSMTMPSVYNKSQRFYDNEARFRKLEGILINRYRKITPNTEQRATTRQMQTKVSRAFEALLDTPLARSGTLPILNYTEVGSFAKRTYMFPNLTSDCAVIMKVRPTKEAVKRLSEHFLIQYNRLNSVQLYKYDEATRQNVYLSDEHTTTPLEVAFNEEGGFEINNEDANVRVMIGCQKHKMSMGVDSNLHINKNVLKSANAAVEHVKWFKEKVTNNKIRILIVLMKDLCMRFEALRVALNPRTIELLAYHCLHDAPGKYDTFEHLVDAEAQIKADNENDGIQEMADAVEISLGEAFIRVFQLLSTGFLTPESSGLVDSMNGEFNHIDPRNQMPNGANIKHHRIHHELQPHLMENLMCTAQTLYRICLSDGTEKIFDPVVASSLERQETIANDVLIKPGQKIYK